MMKWQARHLRFLLFAFTLFGCTSMMAEVSHQSEAFISTRYRKFASTPSTSSFAKDNQDQFFYLKHELRDEFLNVNWVASPFVLFSHSNSVDQGSDPILTQIFTSNRQLDLDSRFDRDRRNWTNLDFQELYFETSSPDFKMHLGRRIFSLGNMKLFSVWNKFNPTALSARPNWTSGIDQFKLTWQKDNSKLAGYNIFDQDRADRAQILIYEYFESPVQMNLLLGDWWYAHSAGLSTTADISGWLFKLETLYMNYYDRLERESDFMQTALGVEHGFARDWTANFEIFHQNRGAKSKYEMATTSRTPHQSFLGQTMAALEIRWNPDPFYNFAGIFAHSFVDYSQLMSLVATKQWNDNLESSLGILLPQKDGELGPHLTLLSPTSGIGIPTQVDLTLKAYF